MSILLEALRKSESQRRLGETPTLQTPEEPDVSSTDSSTRWLPAVFIISAASLMGWLGWMQYQQPEVTAADPTASGFSENVQLAAESDTANSGATSAAAEPVSDDQEQNKSVPTPRNPMDRLVSNERTLADHKSSAEEKRKLLGKSFQSYDETADKPSADQTGEMTPARTGKVTAAEATRPADSIELPVDLPDPASSPGNASAEAADEADTISFWQLPQSVRDGMPEIRINVLVFAQRPEERFILINGQRLRESEELENGLVLEEIRRDRAVFSYRKYVFHLKS